MTNPTEAPEAPPRWRLEPTLTTDQAPSAFPMREEDETACAGGDAEVDVEAPLDSPEAFADAVELDVLLPDETDPFADLEPLLDAEKLDEPDVIPCVPPDCPPVEEERLGELRAHDDDECTCPPADSDPADPDGGPERPEQGEAP